MCITSTVFIPFGKSHAGPMPADKNTLLKGCSSLVGVNWQLLLDMTDTFFLRLSLSNHCVILRKETEALKYKDKINKSTATKSS